MRIEPGKSYLVEYAREAYHDLALCLLSDGSIYNPPGQAEFRWSIRDDGAFIFLNERGESTGVLQPDQGCYRGLIFNEIKIELRPLVPWSAKGQATPTVADLTIVTMVTEFDRGFVNFWNSCRYWGITPLILGYGLQFGGFTQKARLLFRALCRLYKTTRIVLFADGFDSLLVGSPQSILDEYVTFQSPLVFSAERNCWPDAEKANAYPPAQTPYRFLNSGGYIGEARYILRLLASAGAVAWPSGSDQRQFMQVFLNRPDSITLDHECRIFQCLHLAEEDVEYRAEGIHNRITGSMPKVLHANGHSNLAPALRWLDEAGLLQGQADSKGG
jgi:hypothetical protein